ncbi:hypothetical protein M9Y10_002502 [Tritrichomonas musculus]|uniref:Myb-like DNA-binding domain containing protein n=1 Tax=Tritrichomonas musculus TaxID=1915356 RepID=A0ABR2LA08_9EUKA
MTETSNCVILPSIDCLPLTQLYINFFQEQEEKAKKIFSNFDIGNHNPKNTAITHSEQQQIYPSFNVNSMCQNNILQSAPQNVINNLNQDQNITSQPKVSKLKGSWSLEEDQKLREAVANCDPIIWDVIAEKVPGRSAIQCKERWLYRLHPEVKKTRFEKWEDDLIISERNRVGNHWTLISNKLPGRTSCAVKNRWYSVLINKVRQNDSIVY